MAARKVQLKDKSGNKAYPVTSSACVGMSDGSGSLDEKISGIISNSGYVACTTAAGTAAKTVTQANFSLSTNSRLIVKMTNYNTAASPTLNINNTGAKPLYYNGEVASADNTWVEGEVLDIYYDGTNYKASNILGGSGTGGNQILKWTTDVATTRLQVKQNKRKSGMIISYNDPEKGWINEQYIGTTFGDTAWGKDYNWRNFNIIHSKISNDIDILYSIGNDLSTSATFELGGILITNGNVELSNNTLYSGYIEITTGAKYIRTNLVSSPSNSTFGLAFYDSSRRFISGFVADKTAVQKFDLYTISVPENSKYLRTTIWNDSIMEDNDFDDFKCFSLSSQHLNGLFNVAVNNVGYTDIGINVLDGGTTGKSAVIETSDYIWCKNSYKVILDNVLYKQKTDYGIAFYDDNKHFLSGRVFKISNDGTYKMEKEEISTLGYSYFRCSKLQSSDTQEISLYFEDLQHYLDYNSEIGKSIGNDIYIAASDSNEYDKSIATFVCDGANDEVELNEACKLIRGNGTIHLAEGNYYIDDFISTENDTPYYVFNTIYSNGQTNLTIVCDNNKNMKTSSGAIASDNITIGAIIRVSENCYSSLDDSKKYSIIRCSSDNGGRPYPYTFLNVNGIGFKLPDNEKPITCIDGYFATAMDIRNCTFHAVKNSNNLKLGNMNCIGIKGLQGANYGTFNYVIACIAWGFGQGFALAGEHLYVEQCLTRFCRYGYTFNNFNHPAGNYVHGMFIYNCGDELGFNMPLFGGNGSCQPIYMEGFNLEWDSDYYTKFEGEGNLMKESTPGDWRGKLSYTLTSKHSGFVNTINEPIWAPDGSGRNVKSINDAHKTICDSNERKSYAPNVGQIIYDTTLKKAVMCIDANQKKWVDFNGNEID